MGGPEPSLHRESTDSLMREVLMTAKSRVTKVLVTDFAGKSRTIAGPFGFHILLRIPSIVFHCLLGMNTYMYKT